MSQWAPRVSGGAQLWPTQRAPPLPLPDVLTARRPHQRVNSITLDWVAIVDAEFQVRQALADHHDTLAGLYSGNPKRATTRPTAELLLASFRDITLIRVNARGQTYAHVTELTLLQQRILQTLNFPVSIYTRLGPESEESP